MPAVPDVVRARATAAGPAGERWLTELPRTLAALQESWGITVGEPLPGGSASYVVRARTAGGVPVVVKLAVPDPAFVRLVRALEAAAGNGYVRLLAQDVDRGTVLLEALGPSLDVGGGPPEDQLRTLGAMLRRAWQVRPPSEVALEGARDKAAELAELVADLWERLGHPCPEAVVERALQYAARRSAAFAAERCVLVHGDAGPPNALRVLRPRPGGEVGHVFVDPDGDLGDPAYDLGVALRGWCDELLAADEPVELLGGWCRLLAGHGAADRQAVWEWGFLERVSTGLYAMSFGATDVGRQYLDSAAVLAQAWSSTHRAWA